MQHYDEITKFEKDGLTVIVDKTDETLPLEITFDESVYDLNDINEKIKDCTYDYFILRVRVLHQNYELASNTIGGCLYEDAKKVLIDGTADSLIEQTFEEAQIRLKDLVESLQSLNLGVKMISLNQHRSDLKNLHHTITAMENIDAIIELLDKNHQGHNIGIQIPDIQNHYISGYVDIHSDILISALTQQKDKLVAYLASFGIQA